MKTLILKSLLTSLYQREEMHPSLAKRGKGRFFNNDALLMNSLVIITMKLAELLNERRTEERKSGRPNKDPGCPPKSGKAMT